MTTTLTIRLSPDVLEDLQRLAEATRRSKAFLAAEAVSEMVRNQKWQIEALEEARGQIARGEVVSADAVEDWLRSWGTDHQTPVPHSQAWMSKAQPPE